ncbi:hypothetical protein CHARACLAT_027976 [Characodon lateralis]|uniref:Uncharacterized protein n=1 Tax=Characodon lateralis TaxID=208331 RepID=A0ABU7DCL6_9TELE|nr:hypothetical protein [Characodon lateralis]
MTKTSLSICDTVNRSREEAEISTAMLKVALILGCLLSLIVAEPLEHQRFARSSSGSDSNEVQNSNFLNSLLAILLQLLATTTTTTTAATTTATTPRAAT